MAERILAGELINVCELPTENSFGSSRTCRFAIRLAWEAPFCLLELMGRFGRWIAPQTGSLISGELNYQVESTVLCQLFREIGCTPEPRMEPATLGFAFSLEQATRNDCVLLRSKNVKALDKSGSSWHHMSLQYLGLLYLDRIQES